MMRRFSRSKRLVNLAIDNVCLDTPSMLVWPQTNENISTENTTAKDTHYEPLLNVPLDNIENYLIVDNVQIEVLDEEPVSCLGPVSNEFTDKGVNILDCISDTSENINISPAKLVPYTSSSEDSDIELPKKSKTKKRRSQVDKSNWFAEKNKKLRERGYKYFGKVKKDSKWVYETVKESKHIKERCKCRTKNSILKCATIKEEQRKELWKTFWRNLDWGEKKLYVDHTVKSCAIKRARDRKEPENSRRSQSLRYYLKLNDEEIRVCKTMYLNTLCIGRMTVLTWKDKMKQNSEPSQLRTAKEKNNPHADRQQSLHNFFKSLPLMESHYCRASTSKKYLQPDWPTKSALYKFYVTDWCVTHNTKALSSTVFFDTMTAENISLFRPKKDECEKCTKYKMGTIEENEYLLHKLKKEEAREEKRKDKEEQSLLFTVDMQSVLLAPKSNVSLLYYKTKLQVHNLCFYNNINKDGYCFLWNETEGGLSAEEFTSIWIYFFEQKCLSQIENREGVRLIIYSDGCGYQNRNTTLSNALLNMAVINNITIEQKYLEVGHTQMEVDSMHSLIERKLRNKHINVPADYVQVVQSARKKPFDVTYLEHTFFKKFESVSSYKNIRPGRTTGDPKVSDIRALKYSPSGVIYYKLRFGDPWTLLPQRKTSVEPKTWHELDCLHHNRIPISARKFEDLQVIKETLPQDFRQFYSNLPKL